MQDIFNYLSQIDFPIFFNFLYSICLVYFDCRYLCYPLMIWAIFFIFFALTMPVTSLVLSCIGIAILTEIFPLHIGSGDWLYLSLLAYSINYLQLVYCILFASAIALVYMLSLSVKKKELPFIPFLLLGYLLTLYFIHI